MIWLVIKLLIKFWKPEKPHHRIVYRFWAKTENDKGIPKERYTSPEERQKIIDNLRLI